VFELQGVKDGLRYKRHHTIKSGNTYDSFLAERQGLAHKIESLEREIENSRSNEKICSTYEKTVQVVRGKNSWYEGEI